MDKLKLEVKYKNKICFSVALNDYRVGGIKWNSVESNRVLSLYAYREDVLDALNMTKDFLKLKQKIKDFCECWKCYDENANSIMLTENSGIRTQPTLYEELDNIFNEYIQNGYKFKDDETQNAGGNDDLLCD